MRITTYTNARQHHKQKHNVKTIQGDLNSQKSDQLPIANRPLSPFALSSFLCACSLRRFWLLSFTISLWRTNKFQKAEKSRRLRSWSRPSGWYELSEGRAQASAGFRFSTMSLMALACPPTAPLSKKKATCLTDPGTTNPNGATLQLAHVDNFLLGGISTCSSGKIFESEA